MTPPGRPPGDRPQQRLDWALAELHRQGHTVQAVSEPAYKAWSVIVRLLTPDGPVYLKYVRGAFLHEPGLTRALHRLAPDHLPDILADNPDLGCWLVGDGGAALVPRVLADDGHVPRLMTAHAALQRATLGDAGSWLALGAKDVRPDRWAGFLDDILAATGALTLDKVTQPVLTGLAAARDPLARLAARVAALNPPMTVVHLDLRRVNIRIRRGRVRVIDWGDAGFGPALLDPVPLLSELAQMGLAETQMQAVRAAHLAPWDGHATDDLQQIAAACRTAFPLIYAHGLIHARPSWDATLKPTFYGLLQGYLSIFLERLSA